MNLKLFVGDTSTFAFVLNEASGEAEDLTGLTAATFTMKTSSNDTSPLLSLGLGTGLTLVQPNRLEAALSAPQATALAVGTYLGQLKLTFGAISKVSDLFYVQVVKALS